MRRSLLIVAFSFWMSTTTFALPGILDGPYVYNGHTYHLLENSNWTDAEAAAVNMGGHLATINDAAENEWVWNTFGDGINNSLWIGLHDQTPDRSFAWINGEPLAYTNWDPVEPNNQKDVNNYGHMWAWSTLWGDPEGQWTDYFNLAVISASDTPLHQPTPLFGVVEIVPEPSAVLLLFAGVIFILRRRS